MNYANRSMPHQVEAEVTFDEMDPATGKLSKHGACNLCGRKTQTTTNPGQFAGWLHHIDPAYDEPEPAWFAVEHTAADLLPPDRVDAAELLNTDRLVEG